jgi:hypothetical protein
MADPSSKNRAISFIHTLQRLRAMIKINSLFVVNYPDRSVNRAPVAGGIGGG